MSTRRSRGDPAPGPRAVSLRGAAVGAAIAFAVLAARAEAGGTVPMRDYARASIHGFEVLVAPAVLAHPDDAARTRAELDRQLAAVAATVPAPHLDAMRGTRIWVEWDARPDGAAEFHVSADWLRANGYLAEKLAGVEIGNARHFVTWSRQDQPWMLLHELAHARLHAAPALQAEASAALEAARRAGLYAMVDNAYGDRQPAYALTDAHEYFAELSEAWFGRNDFFPYARAELKAYDPRGAALMQAAWAPARVEAAARLVRIGEARGLDACPSLAVVADGEPVALHAAPSVDAPILARLPAGTLVHACDDGGDEGWVGVVIADAADCGVAAPVPAPRAYAGPCRQGWLPWRALQVVAG